MNFPSATTPPGGARPRALVRTLALGAMLGIGTVGAGTTLVHAADDAGVLDFLLGDVPRKLGLPARALRPEAGVNERRTRWSSRPAKPTAERPRWIEPASRHQAEAARSGSQRPVAASGRHDGAGLGARTVCVRTCDGYLFPLANFEGRTAPPAQELACAAACPGAETALYTVRAGEDLDQAVSRTGKPYRSLAAAFAYRSQRVKSCSCNPGAGGYARLLLTDATLQPGDAVAGATGAQVFAGRGRKGEARFVDFRNATMLSANDRRELDRTLDVSRLERARAEFHRALTTQSGSGFGRLRYAAGSAGFPEVVSDASAAPIRIVVPSPFR
ncbi:DUF2865 domain-containing protein [Methylobacterium aquaticum]|uniref:DUF2865 domain-containing protein n=1 Tax=Methylobacterium aquaticum TaxID=270351 RepID=UPI003D175564